MAHSGKTITFATDLLPQEDNIYNLGIDGQKWKIRGDITSDKVTTFKLATPLTNGSRTAQVETSPYQGTLWKFNASLPVSSLATGDTIIIKTPGAGGSYGVFLSLDNGNTYRPISMSGTSRLTTHFSSGVMLILTYNASGSVNTMRGKVDANGILDTTTGDNTVSGGRWEIMNLYDSGNSNDSAGYIRYWGSETLIKTTATTYAYQLMFSKGDGQSYIPANTTKKSTATTKSTITTASFNIFDNIFYHSYDEDISSGSSIRFDRVWLMYRIDLRYSFNIGSTLTAGKDVYLVVSSQDGIMATLRNPDAKEGNAAATATGTNAGPITQTLPSSDDGYLYIKLGTAYNTYCIILTYKHPIYWYKNGALRLYSGASEYSLAAPLSGISGADDLKAIEALSGTSGLLKKTAANTWTLDTTGYTTNTGTVTKVSTGAGLTGGDITTSGTIKANLTSETKLTNAAADGTETSGRVYPVRLDKNGKLAVNVPWTNVNSAYLKTDGTNNMTGTLNIKPASGEGGEIHLHAVANTEAGIVLDHYGNSLRVFGIASADETTKTGTGTPLVIDPYAKTITGGYTLTGALTGNATTATTSTWTTLIKPIASTTTASASTWNIPSGSYQVWGERFSDTRLKYTPSGGSETTITDTGDWVMWLTPTSGGTATLNMRIDGTYYGSFSGNGSSLTSLNASNISSGTVAFARLPTGTGASQVAIGNHTHGWANLTDNADSLSEGNSDWTDNTEILTSYASNNGFADTNAKGKVYRRDAIKAYNYIKGKLDSIYATQTTVNGLLAAADAMIFKGTLGTNGTITALPDTHNAGDTYRVITTGTYAGKYCAVGTLIICVKDGTAAADADWTSVETNEDGAVIGPTAANSTTDNAIVRWNSTVGRVIQNSKAIIDDNGNISTTISTTDSIRYRVANSNGAVSILTSTNRGLYDDTNSSWIIYRAQAGNHTYIPQWASKGGEAQPIYFNSNGEPVACTTYANATVAKAEAANLTTTANAIAYYSNTTGTFANGSNVRYLNSTITVPAGTANITATGLTIHGTSCGNAAQVLGNTDGAITYGDGGPQIRFSTGQDGAMIYSHHDNTSGMGAAFHFVSSQTDTAVKASGLIATTRAIIGSQKVNTSYVLYSNGATYINGNLTTNGNISTTGKITTGNITVGGTVDTDAGKRISSSSTLRINRATNTSIVFEDNTTIKMRIDTSNNFRPETTNTLSIGTSDYKWNAMYATTFYGALSGNATSATAIQTAGTTAQFYRGDNSWSNTLTDSLNISKAGSVGIEVDNTQATNPNKVAFIVGSTGNGGIFSRKHGKWIVYADASGNVVLNGNANTATKVGTDSIWLYPESNNRLNFGGTNNSTTIYLGYAAKDSRGIPTKFIFGNSTGTADIQAAKLIGGSGSFTLQWNSTDSSIDFVFA